jgi:hypothetical protein
MPRRSIFFMHPETPAVIWVVWVNTGIEGRLQTFNRVRIGFLDEATDFILLGRIQWHFYSSRLLNSFNEVVKTALFTTAALRNCRRYEVETCLISHSIFLVCRIAYVAVYTKCLPRSLKLHIQTRRFGEFELARVEREKPLRSQRQCDACMQQIHTANAQSFRMSQSQMLSFPESISPSDRHMDEDTIRQV